MIITFLLRPIDRLIRKALWKVAPLAIAMLVGTVIAIHGNTDFKTHGESYTLTVGHPQEDVRLQKLVDALPKHVLQIQAKAQ
jgi:hypothetical protein